MALRDQIISAMTEAIREVSLDDVTSYDNKAYAEAAFNAIGKLAAVVPRSPFDHAKIEDIVALESEDSSCAYIELVRAADLTSGGAHARD